MEWSTTLEDTVALFEIQRSADFFHFETLGTLLPTGPSSYQFEDIAPFKGSNVYRIKVYSHDRAFDYSNLVTVSFPPKPDINIYPNPADNAFTVFIKEALGGIIEFELFNPAGIRMLSTTWEAMPGEANQQMVIIDHLQNGLYYYRVKNGEQQKAGTLLVK